MRSRTTSQGVNHWFIWTEAMYRANPRITKSDIAKAIDWYHERTGEMPGVIGLNPKNGKLVIPSNMELVMVGGCLRSEVWLARCRPVPAPMANNISNEISGNYFWCAGCLQDITLIMQSPDIRYCQSCYDSLLAEAENLPPDKIPRWVPRSDESSVIRTQDKKQWCNRSLPMETIGQDDVTARIAVLAGQGMSTRGIAQVLQAKGIEISHMTVARRLQGVMIQ